MCSIAQALSLAVPGDRIFLSPGVYFENVSASFDIELISTAGAEVTTIDAAGMGRALTVSAGATVEIRGLTLTGGLTDRGGAVLCFGDVTLRECLVLNNEASEEGGGIHVDGSAGPASATVIRTMIRDNQSIGGGGIFVKLAALEVLSSLIFRNNGAPIPSYGGGTGGGIFANGPSALSIRETTIPGNEGEWGAGLSIVGPPPRALMSHVTVTENTASVCGGAWRSSLCIRIN